MPERERESGERQSKALEGPEGLPQKKEKGDKKNELKERLAKLKKLRFYEEMADFMNWSLYYKLTDEIHEIENELKKRGE